MKRIEEISLNEIRKFTIVDIFFEVGRIILLIILCAMIINF